MKSSLEDALLVLSFYTLKAFLLLEDLSPKKVLCKFSPKEAKSEEYQRMTGFNGNYHSLLRSPFGW